MRIGLNFVGAISQDSGGRNYAINFTRVLPELNSDHHFVLFMSPGEKEMLAVDAPCIEVVEVPYSKRNSIAKVFGEQILLPPLIRNHKIDVMYYPGNFASYLCPVPYVLAIRSMLYYHHPYAVDAIRRTFRKCMTPLSAKRSYRIITPSQDIKNDVMNFIGISDEQVAVIHHGIDVGLFADRGDETERQGVLKQMNIRSPYLLYVSALWPYKNQDKLILAFQRLVQEYDIPHQLVIVGRGINSYETYQASLFELAEKCNLQDRIIFTGFVEHARLRYLYQSADLYVYPSSYESFGNPLFEAMAAGVPVASANVHSFPEMVQNAAVMFDPNDIDDMAQTIYRVLDDAQFQKQLIEAGRLRVQDFSWADCVRESICILEAAKGSG